MVVLFKTLSFLNIQFCRITVVVFLCAIAKPYKSLAASLRLSPGRKQPQTVSGLRREPTFKVWQTFCLLGIWPGGFPSVWCWRARASGRRLTAPIGLASPHQPRLPPSAAVAPVGLACPHGEEEGSSLVLSIGLRLWQSALGFASLCFISKSIVFLLFGSTDDSSCSSSSPSSSRVNTLRLLAGFHCIFPFAQIHFHAFLQMRLQQYTEHSHSCSNSHHPN